MATNVFVRGLSGRGFRVPDSADTYKLKTCKEGVAVQVDLDDALTRSILRRERDNFIRVTNGASTTVQISGLGRRGFRIKNNGGSIVVVKVGTAATTVNLDDYNVLRTLQRNKREWFRTSDPTSLNIRGLAETQEGFFVEQDVAATAILTTTGVNVSDNDTVTINNVTYRFKTTIAQANDVDIGADSNDSLDQLVQAINGTGVSGTDYFAGTARPTNVTAAARSGTGASATVTLTVSYPGAVGNTFVSTEVAATLAFSNGGTFTGGQELAKVVKGTTISGVNVSGVPFNYQQLRRQFRNWIEA